MAVTYGLAANAAYYVLNQLGLPAARGFMVTVSSVTGAPQVTYADPAGSQVNPTVMRLNEAGCPDYPVYWAKGDGFDLYLVRFYDADGSLIREINNYPIETGGDGGGDVVVNNNVVNYFENPQFSFWSEGTSFDNTALPLGTTRIADKWLYTRASTNATVSISRGTFLPGENAVPFSPPHYLIYSCTGAGSDTANFVSQRFNSVQMLTNQTMTDAIYASVLSLGGTSQLTLLVIQNFGTGGSAPVETIITTFNIDDSWQRYASTFTIPNIAGKVIGAQGDDYLEICWQFKSNQIIDVGLVDVAGQSGNGSGIDFPYLSPNEQYAELLPYNLAGQEPDQGTNLVGKKEWGTLETWCQAVQATNFLIGWDFYNNPNQLGAVIASGNNGEYIADQTILLSDGDGIVAKNSFISEPLTLEVLTNAKKFGIFQIIEDVNSANLRGQIASVCCSLYADAPVTVKVAVVGWNGNPGDEIRAAWTSASLPGTDPLLAAGWEYIAVSNNFTIDNNTSYPQLSYLNNVTMNSYTSYGVIIWNDGVELTVGEKIYFQNNALTLGNSAFFPTPLPFQDVLLKCQRYYHRTYSWREPLAVGAITGLNSQTFYPQAVWEVPAVTIRSVFPTTLVLPNTLKTYASSLFANYQFPVEMYKDPALRFFDPTTGAEGNAHLFVDTLGPLVYVSGSFGIAVQLIAGDTRSRTIYFQESDVISYSSPGSGDIVAAPIIITNIVADALLGV